MVVSSHGACHVEGEKNQTHSVVCVCSHNCGETHRSINKNNLLRNQTYQANYSNELLLFSESQLYESVGAESFLKLQVLDLVFPNAKNSYCFILYDLRNLN